MPWGQNLKFSVPTNTQGWPTLKGYMAQCSLKTYLDVRRTCELLAYLGYHTAGTENQLSAITVTKAQRSGGCKKPNTRTVLMGHVIGPPGVGETTFCQGLLDRTIDEIDTSNLWCELPRYVARQLSVYGQSKIFLLHDVDALGASTFLNATKCARTEYECFDGKCIPGDMLCDDVVDCIGGEDEKGPFKDLECPADVFRCLDPSQNRSQEMIPMSAVCDGKRNCSNGMDERKCASISDEFPVVTDKYGNPLKMSASGFLVIRLQGRLFPFCTNGLADVLTKAT